MGFKKGYTPWNKGKKGLNTGKKLSEETKQKIREAVKNRPSNRKGKKHSDESKEKMRQAHLGKKLTEEHKIKIGSAQKGKKISAEVIEKRKKFRHTEESRKKISEAHTGKKQPWSMGAKNPAWKGDDVGYYALHRWIERNYGKPDYCEFCMTTEKRKYEWANISHKYNRDFCDWLRLCIPCHRKFDISKKI